MSKASPSEISVSMAYHDHQIREINAIKLLLKEHLVNHFQYKHQTLFLAYVLVFEVI